MVAVFTLMWLDYLINLNRTLSDEFVRSRIASTTKWLPYLSGEIACQTTLWQTNIAMENGPVEDVFPIENEIFHCHVSLLEGKGIWWKRMVSSHLKTSAQR